MECCMGAMDSNAFQGMLQQGYLPQETSIQYEGVFNEHYYQIDQAEKENILSVQTKTAVCQDVDSKLYTPYVSCILTSKYDGQPRDSSPIDLNVVLDISGSMGCGLGNGSNQNKLTLAKKTIQSLFTQSLRENDGFGLAVFDTQGDCLHPMMQKSEINPDKLREIIQPLQTRGGTTLQAGLKTGIDMFQEYIQKQDKNEYRQRRILLLTDMEDMSSDQLNQLIQEATKQQIYVSIIGIGIDFNTSIAESIVKNEGCNYFCVTKDEQMTEIIVDRFQYSFFPSAFKVNLQIQSDDFELVKTYGTPFDDTILESSSDVQQQFPQQISDLQKKWVSIAEINTMTPSAIIQDKYIKGGLVLLQLKHKDLEMAKSANLKGQLNLSLSYCDQQKEKTFQQDYQVVFDVQKDLFYENLTVKKAIYLKEYVQICKNAMIEFQKTNTLAAEQFGKIKDFQKQFFKEMLEDKQLLQEQEIKDLENVNQQLDLFIQSCEKVMKNDSMENKGNDKNWY